MVLKYENNRITGYGSYEHRDTFKFHGCKWDKETNSWFVPETADREIVKKVVEKINEIEREKTTEKWIEACKECNVRFANKGTPQYEQVLKRFKELK